jgi:hypothetical protein
MTETEILEAAARAAHEANRAYCLALGGTSQVSWEAAPECQRVSAIKAAEEVWNGNTPEQSHESWLAEKIATGWKYGPVKSSERKEHPCMVPYRDLPPSQRMKDHIFVRVTRAVLDALTYLDNP